MINKNFNKMELFELFVGFIQLLSYGELQEQVGNNDLDKKLDEQNNFYLKTIIENQKLILKKLNKISECKESNNIYLSVSKEDEKRLKEILGNNNIIG